MICSRKQPIRLLLAGLSMLFALPAWAQSPSAGEWKFSSAPYVWLINIEGDATVGGHTSKVDTNIFEIIDQSDSIFAYQGHFEVSNGRWGGFLDVTYMDLTLDASVGPIDADVAANYALVELGGFYRVAESSLDAGSADTNNRNVAFDLLAGGRYTYLSVDLDISAGPASGAFDGSEEWVDPFVGGRVTVDLTDRLVFVMRGDIGGFGVGSDFTWNALGLLGYRFEVFHRPAVALIGYRALYQDYSSGSGSNEFGLDLTMHGPILGVRFEF